MATFTITVRARRTFGLMVNNQLIGIPGLSAYEVWLLQTGNAGKTEDEYFADIKGEDGEEIELQASATHIQWRYVGGTTWTNIVALSELKGESGDDGVGITSVTLTATNGLVKTYTILFTNNTTTTFDVTDGDKGDKGDQGLTEEQINSILSDYETILGAAGKYEPLISKSAGYAKWTGSAWSFLNETYLTSVTAHDLLSATHGDTAASAVARGSIIVGNATPKWAALAFPSTPTGKVLIATATDIEWSSAALGTGAYATIANYLPLAGGTMTGGITNSTSVNPLTTLAESWIGPSSTTGVYFKGGNVGIGTTSPSSLLHLNASTGNLAQTLQISSGNKSWINFAEGEVNGSGFTLLSDGSGVGDANVFSILSGSGVTPDVRTARLSIQGDSGNVGIGITAPSEKLEVYSTSTTNLKIKGNYAQALLQVTNDANYADVSFLNTAGATRGYLMYDFTSDFMACRVAGSEAVRINNVGNVGIGTTGPNTKLDVSDNVGGNVAVNLTNLNNGTAGQVRYQLLNDRNNASLNSAFFNMYSSGNTNTTFGLTMADYVGLMTYGSNNNGLVIGTINDKPLVFGRNNAEVMRIGISGNVGIGTTSPEAKLHVSAGGILLDNNQSLKFKDSAGTLRNILTWSSADNITLAGVAGSDVYLQSSSTFALKSSGAVIVGSAISGGSKLSVAGNLSVGATYKGTLAPDNGAIFEGNVGIGTTAPSRKLYVYQTDASAGAIFGYSTDSNYIGTVLSATAVRTSSDAFKMFSLTTGTAEVFTVLGNGNVGIGLTAPLGKLGLKGTATWASGYNSNDFQIFDPTGLDNANYGFFINQSFPASTAAGAFTIGTGSTNNHTYDLAFSTLNTERMRIIQNGNVGIGLTTPIAKLDILDTILAGSAALAGSIFNLAQTWNTTGTPTAIKLTVTDTASNANSLLMDLIVGATSKFSISKAGVPSTAGSAGVSGTFTTVDLKTVTVTNGLITSIV